MAASANEWIAAAWQNESIEEHTPDKIEAEEAMLRVGEHGKLKGYIQWQETRYDNWKVAV